MNAVRPLISFVERSLSRAAQASTDFLRSAAFKADAEAMVFSAKSFLAAMVAYYVALRMGLPKPYWAIVTVYIVSQTASGPSFSRGLYRLAGTIVGAAATVLIISTFVGEPIVCGAVLSGWIGLCLFLSLLDRTPRAYAYVLAGYTASLIGFPGVADPAALFDTASLRVQEIGLGVICAVLVHRFILPRPITGQFIGKLSATLKDARRLAVDAMDGAPDEQDRRDRHRLAADLLVLRGLAAHLPYDVADATPRSRHLSLIHDRLARLLPLATEIEDRIRTLGGDTPQELTGLLRDIVAWIEAPTAADEDAPATRLIDRAEALRKTFSVREPHGRIAANLAGRLAEVVGILHDCDGLRRAVAAPRQTPDVSVFHRPKSASRGYVFHRAPLMAAWGASGAALSIFAGCLIWIVSAWPEGGQAISILGVSCSLFGTVDAPAPNVMKYLKGLIYGIGISLTYSFLILPRVTEFPVLIAVLAPAFLFAGSLQARLPTTFMALGVTLTIPILANLASSYQADFAVSINTSVAVVAAVLFSIMSMSLVQTVPVDVTIARLRDLNRRDVRRRALGSGPDEARWTSLMIDRTALLLPRLPLSRHPAADVLDETLHLLRIGHAAGQVRATLPDADDDFDRAGRALLSRVARHFQARQRLGPAVPAVSLAVQTDQLIRQVADSARTGHARLIDSLVDLRFALAALDTSGTEKTP